MGYDELIEEIHTLLGRQAIGPPLCQRERERLDSCMKELNSLTSSCNRKAVEEHVWIRTHAEVPPTKAPSAQVPNSAAVIRSGTLDFLRGVAAALVSIPLLCLIMVGCCVAGRWVAEQLVLPELPVMFAAACMLPGVLLLLGAKELAKWLDRTLFSYDEEDDI